MKLKDLSYSKPIVYVDMDGVLADLYNYASEIHDVDHYKEMTKDQWEAFFKDSDAYHLFRSIPKFETANKLIDLVISYAGSYRILSSPLNYDREGSIKGKKEWIESHLPIKPEQAIFETDKYKYALQPDGSPNILIDDYRVNTTKWDLAGGIAIKYQADEDSLEIINDVLEKVFEE